MLDKVPGTPTLFHRSAATQKKQTSSQSNGINPPGPTRLNQSILWGKGNFGASPALKTIAGALIPLGVTLWVSGTLYSAHESVRPKDQSFCAHIAESAGWGALGIPLIIGSYLASRCCGPSSGVSTPPDPTLLGKFTRYGKKIVASPIMKNIGAILTGAGAGAALGCPWMVTLLIGVGVGTSWAGGIGLAIAAAGIVLWMISTHFSMQEKPQEQDARGHIAESAGMAVIGLPCAILDAMLDCCRRCNDLVSADTQAVSGMPGQTSPSGSEPDQDEPSENTRDLSRRAGSIDDLELAGKYASSQST